MNTEHMATKRSSVICSACVRSNSDEYMVAAWFDSVSKQLLCPTHAQNTENLIVLREIKSIIKEKLRKFEDLIK